MHQHIDKRANEKEEGKKNEQCAHRNCEYIVPLRKPMNDEMISGEIYIHIASIRPEIKYKV